MGVTTLHRVSNVVCQATTNPPLEQYQSFPETALTDRLNVFTVIEPVVMLALATREHIWITDEILNQALHAFTLFKSPRRYGSAIPGPLEARRRLAKRRMMDLASHGAGPNYDNAMLGWSPPIDRRDWQLQNPTTPPSMIFEPNESSRTNQV